MVGNDVASLSPTTLVFAVIVFGLCIGRLKVWHISLDMAAVLIVAVAVGGVLRLCGIENDPMQMMQLQSYMETLSSVGSAIFVSMIGISTGYAFQKGQIKEKLCAVLLGAAMVASAFGVMHLMEHLGLDISHSLLLGTLCGALTTTPGLSMICENPNVISADAILGYGCAYLIGVVFTVLFVQCIVRRQDAPSFELNREQDEHTQPSFGGIFQLSISILFGIMIGSIKINGFSLANTGGILCVGILIGILTRIFRHERCITAKQSSTIKALGLLMFFVGNGIPAGLQLHREFSLTTVCIGAILSVTPLLAGWILSRVLFQKKHMAVASILAGGMTSTPAIGVLSSKKDVSYEEYSFAYLGALLCIILLFRCTVR